MVLLCPLSLKKITKDSALTFECGHCYHSDVAKYFNIYRFNCCVVGCEKSGQFVAIKSRELPDVVTVDLDENNEMVFNRRKRTEQDDEDESSKMNKVVVVELKDYEEDEMGFEILITDDEDDVIEVTSEEFNKYISQSQLHKTQSKIQDVETTNLTEKRKPICKTCKRRVLDNHAMVRNPNYPQDGGKSTYRVCTGWPPK